MVNLSRIQALFRPSMYMHADNYRTATGQSIEWELEVRITGDEPGIALRSRRDATAPWTETLIPETELERAFEAGLEWRYRLVGGPASWRARPLWRRRDQKALLRLFQRHCALVFAVPA